MTVETWLLVAILVVLFLSLFVRGGADTSGRLRAMDRKLDVVLKNLGIDPYEGLDKQVTDLARSGQKIEAIKLYRAQTGVGLKEAKDYVEGLYTLVWARPVTLSRGAAHARLEAPPLPDFGGTFAMHLRPTISGQPTSRREFLAQAGGGLGAIALASLLHRDRVTLQAATTALPSRPLEPKASHFGPRATRVIYLFMHGGPSHVDLFDPKPELMKYAGQPLPESVGEVMTRRKVASNPLLGPIKPFHPRGKSGLPISEFLPQIAEMADELCVLRGCHGDSVNHPQSVYQMNTGSILMGRPSLGSWVSYGLRTENDSLPAFVVLPDPGAGIKGGPAAWGNGYLPATYQGTTFRPGATPVVDLRPQRRISAAQQQGTLELLRELNRRDAQLRANDGALEARIEAYELAFRMQSAAPEVVDLSGETAETFALYGIGEKPTDEFGRRCLLARRLVERGVRFVQLYSGDTNGWDAHNDVLQNHGEHCAKTDKPVAGLLRDLKRRGLLDDTLVIWGGEFGRMPMSEQGKGRDHNPWGYSVWLAGARVRGGFAYGATDPFGLRAVEDKVHVHDLHATILHLLGLDHKQLTYFHNGRDERLTDVAGRVVTEILA